MRGGRLLLLTAVAPAADNLAAAHDHAADRHLARRSGLARQRERLRKINLLQQPVSSDPKLQELFTELSDTRFALAQAYVRFDNTTEPELVDACIFELNALQSRYNYLLRLVKESGGIAASRIYSEGAVTWV